MLEDLNQHSVLYIALTKWAPPLITILIGGLFASILFPRWQSNFSRNKAREERKLEVYEDVSKWVNRYRVCWKRVVIISTYEANQTDGLDEAQSARKQNFLEARNDARLELSDAMCRAELYFSDSALEIVKEFRKWDDALSSLRLQELPSSAEFDAEFDLLIHTLAQEMRF